MTFLEGANLLWVLFSVIAAVTAIAIVYLTFLVSRRNARASRVSRSIKIESARSVNYGGNPGTIRKISSDPPPFPDIIQSSKRRFW